MIRNRHPADELADVRAEIKQLQIREAELRIELMTSDRHGVQWTAIVETKNYERLDTKAVIEHLGREAMH
jgi:hypothetical protein